MSKEHRNQKCGYNPEVDSSDTDSELSEDTPNSSSNASPQVVCKTGPGNENAAQAGSSRAGLSMGNLRDEILCSDLGNQKFASARPSGYGRGSLLDARRLQRESVPSIRTINKAKSSRDPNGIETSSSALTLYSVDSYGTSSTRSSLVKSMILKSSSSVLPQKFQYDGQSIHRKPEKVEKKVPQALQEVRNESTSMMTQKQRDLLHAMRTCTSKQVLSDNLFCSKFADCESKPFPDGSCNKNDDGVEKEIVEGAQSSVGIDDSDKLLEQGRRNSHQFQSPSVLEIEKVTAEDTLNTPLASSILTNKIVCSKARKTSKECVESGKKKTENSQHQNLSGCQRELTENAYPMGSGPGQSFKKIKSAANDNPAKASTNPFNLDTKPFAHEFNAAEEKVSQSTTEIIKCSESNVFHDEKNNRKPSNDSLLTSEVENLKEALEILPNQQVTRICDKSVATAILHSTSTKNPKNSTHIKSASFADEELRACKSGHEEPLSTSAAVNVSEISATPSVQDFDQDLYVVHFIEKVKKFNVEQLRQMPFENLISVVQQSIKSSTGRISVPFWNLYNDVKATFQVITASVQVMDQDFKNLVCFPDYELQEKLKTFQELKTKIPGTFPVSLRRCVQEITEVFADSYKVYNTFVREGEFKAYEALIEVAADHYYKEVKLAVGDKYRGQVWLDQLHNKCFAATMEHFVSAASFTHKPWEATFTNRFRDKVYSKYREIQTIHIENRVILEEKLEHIKTEIGNLCKNNLVHKITFQALLTSVEKFDEVCKSWKKESHKKFEDAVRNQIGDQLRSVITISTNQFERICDDIVQKERNSWVEKAEKAQADRRQKEREEKEHKEKERLEREREKQEKEKHRQAKGQAQQKGGQPKPNCSQPRQERSSSAMQLSSGSNSDPVVIDDLPLIGIAIYFGIKRTLVGRIQPHTDEFELLAEVENCLYFENHQLVAFSEEEKKKFDRGSGISFSNQFIQRPVDWDYKVKINGETKNFRNEDFISFLFSAIKWHIEMKLEVQVSPDCVICLPQCFHKLQGQVVQGGAKIAGFRNIVLINDTNATSLSFMIRNNILNGTIIAANTSEGFVDAGLFKIENAFIYTEAVSGHHFRQQPSYLSLDYYNYPRYCLFGPLDKRFSDMLSFNGKIPGKYSREAKLVVVGSDQEKTTPVLNFYRMQSSGVHESPYYVIEGAAMLVALDDPQSVVRQRWEGMGHGKVFPDSWSRFRDNLVSERAKDKMKSLNVPKGCPLTNSEIIKKKQNFFIQKQATFHERKIKLLKTCRQLKSDVENKLKKCEEAEVTLLLARLFSVDYEIRRSGITQGELKTVESNLEELYMGFC